MRGEKWAEVLVSRTPNEISGLFGGVQHATRRRHVGAQQCTHNRCVSGMLGATENVCTSHLSNGNVSWRATQSRHLSRGYIETIGRVSAEKESASQQMGRT